MKGFCLQHKNSESAHFLFFSDDEVSSKSRDFARILDDVRPSNANVGSLFYNEVSIGAFLG